RGRQPAGRAASGPGGKPPASRRRSPPVAGGNAQPPGGIPARGAQGPLGRTVELRGREVKTTAEHVRGVPVSTPGHRAQDVEWLVTNCVERVPDVAHAVIVSSDGLPLGVSAGFPQDRADRLATVTSGLSSLAQGAARVFEGGIVIRRWWRWRPACWWS